MSFSESGLRRKVARLRNDPPPAFTSQRASRTEEIREKASVGAQGARESLVDGDGNPAFINGVTPMEDPYVVL